MAELVFVHGAGDSARVWQGQVEAFGGQHRMLLVDLPGHGSRLEEQGLGSHEENAEEVLRLVGEAGFSAPVLIGHSMGGAIVLSLALREPSAARGLVLVGSGARLRMAPALIESARRKAEAATPGQAAGSSAPLELALSPRASAEVREWTGQRVGQATAQATFADCLANDRFDVMERLPEVHQPTLVIAGEDDRMTPPKYQTFLAERLPRARLVLLPAAGHYVQIEQAAAFNQALETFLSELDEP
jgi:pimeloyl-ACP methyl ester carboxylesterase